MYCFFILYSIKSCYEGNFKFMISKNSFSFWGTESQGNLGIGGEKLICLEQNLSIFVKIFHIFSHFQ